MKQTKSELIVCLYEIKTIHKLNAAKSCQQKQWLIDDCKTVKTKKAKLKRSSSFHTQYVLSKRRKFK